MVTVAALLLVVAALAVNEVAGVCDYAAFTTLNVPAGFTTDLASGATVEDGGVANVTCSGDNEYLSDGAESLAIACANDGSGTFTAPGAWPTCVVKCAVPTPASGSGYTAQPDGTVDVGQKMTFTCNETDAEAGDTMGNTYEITCLSNGTFIPVPDDWPVCEVPAECGVAPDPDAANSGLTSEAGTPATTKAYRSVTYHCNDTSLVTDDGKKIYVFCKSDGTFDSPSAWPVCRYPVNCVDFIPLPPLETGLADSTSTVEKEGDDAIYKCSDDPTFLVNGVDPDFTITCGKNGTFPSPIAWPTCIDPTATTTTTTTQRPLDPCQCIGDIPQAEAWDILNKFCRDPTIEGNVYNFAGYTPPSRKRCGNRSPASPTLENHCFCATVEEQAMSSFIFTIALKTEPWQWTSDYSTPSNVSYLQTSTTDMYIDYKMRIEKAIDAVFFNSSLADDYIRASVVKYFKGNDIPLGHFPNEKPTTTTSTTPSPTTAAPTGVTCAATLLDALTVPASLARVGSGDVAAGAKAVYKCANSGESLFTEAGTAGLVQAGNMVELTCASDGTSFTGAPVTWPSDCRTLTETCTVLAPAGDSNMDAQDGSVAEPAVGASLTYTCTNAGDVLDDGSGASSYDVECMAYDAAADPFYEVKLSDPSGWPKCQAPAKRKKRQVQPVQYQYIAVDIDVQFLSYNATNISDVADVYNDLGGSTGVLTEDIIIEKTHCSSSVCKLHNYNPICENNFFNDLPDDYRVVTKFGVYEKPPTLTQGQIDAGVTLAPFTEDYLQAGDLAELTCVTDDTVKKPQTDELDDDPHDDVITVFCMSPQSASLNGRINLKNSDVPPCVSVCTDPLPEAPLNTDLLLMSVIPASNPDTRRNLSDYGSPSKPMYAGDRLVYECRTEYWGVHGGVDTIHDSFECTSEGVYSSPGPNDVWPQCSAQQGMVITAVELRLDAADRRISDRYKMIDYREEDHEKEIVHFSSDYFTTISVPTMVALLFIIFCCCCCTRNGSPLCSLCESKV